MKWSAKPSESLARSRISSPIKPCWNDSKAHGYVRYEDLPLETKDGRKIAVEFVSNVYQAGDKKVIQCNIRDISERKNSERS